MLMLQNFQYLELVKFQAHSYRKAIQHMRTGINKIDVLGNSVFASNRETHKRN